MKTVIKIEKTVNIRFLEIEIPVRYDDEDIPYDFPLRDGDMWRATIDIDTGVIKDWPQGKSGDMYLKVCDEGIYEIFDENYSSIGKLDQEYVPNELVPGEYGDYVDFKIDENGKITNWYSSPDVSEFFRDEDDY